MSDIPVGSPPAPPGRHAAPGGWYADPLDLTRERYWDGWQWSRTTRPAEHPPSRPQAVASATQGPYPTGPGGYGATPQGGTGAYQPTSAGGFGGGTATRQAWATADGVPLAGWWWRALGGLIDALVVGTVSGLLTLPFYRDLVSAVGAYWGQAYRAAQTGSTPPPMPNLAAMISGTDQLLVMLVTFAVGMAYHVPFLRTRAATPGLLACGLRVVPVGQGRSQLPLTWTCVLLRATLWVLPGALSVRILTVADVLVPLWHPKRQTLHDLAAQTQVVRLR